MWGDQIHTHPRKAAPKDERLHGTWRVTKVVAGGQDIPIRPEMGDRKFGFWEDGVAYSGNALASDWGSSW